MHSSTLYKNIGSGFFAENYSLAELTTWEIGGNAKYFYQPTSCDGLVTFLQAIPTSEKIFWLGGGSNVLIRDKGIDGIVIHTKKLNQIKLHNDLVTAATGVTCAKLIRFFLDHELCGAVFLAGIPGTIGGALAMNAGACGDEIWKHVVAVDTVDRFGNIKKRESSEFKAEYRKVYGCLENEWFLNGYLKFQYGAVSEARTKMREFLQRRCKTQPLDKPSCGSVFKNPPNESAGRLIEACGLKGYQFGGAQISLKHANFIINTGKATSNEVESLISFIVSEVENKFHIKLEPEVKIIGEQ